MLWVWRWRALSDTAGRGLHAAACMFTICTVLYFRTKSKPLSGVAAKFVAALARCNRKGKRLIMQPERDDKTGRFLTGNSGGGRPKGSRSKLASEFIDCLQADF